MLKNFKPINRSRLDSLKESDYEFYIEQTGLSRQEVDRIVKIFDERGGVLTRPQFKQVFESLHQNWLGSYKNCAEISDLVFRAFDSSILFKIRFKKSCIIFF
jgi:hypothetical protein